MRVAATRSSFSVATTSLWLACFSSGGLQADARPQFRDKIPNGFQVPNPEIPGAVWAGVGHLAAGGGGAGNIFGQDFKAAGFVWTKALCEMDSDGDGRSNGEELGDPNCLWEEGMEPEGPALSHPGIVDEVDDAPLDSDTCADYEPPSDVQLMEITFQQPNSLSGERTEYICEQMEVTSPDMLTSYYHQIKTEPLLDNVNVLHHMWVYACDGITSSDGDRVGEGSYACNGIEGNCQIVAGWALGMPPICEPNNVGVGLSFEAWTGKTILKIEAHYDNASGLPATDQSGMRLHLTPTLRPLEAGQVILGMDYYDRQFTLPPGEPSVARTSICPTAATLQLPHPIYVYTWNPHMHLYGKSLVTEHYRCGKKIGEIGRIPNFEFDNQQSYILDPPVKILPGDSLVTTCAFDTATSDVAILGGEETTEEMCDNYLGFYPSLWSQRLPDFFTACTSYEEGLNPLYVEYDDYSPFVTLDLDGDIYVDTFEIDPTQNIAPCCNNVDSTQCEDNFLAAQGDPCAKDEDCRGRLVCQAGFCSRSSSSSGEVEDEEDTSIVGTTTHNEAEATADDETDSAGAGFKSSKLLLGGFALLGSSVTALLF